MRSFYGFPLFTGRSQQFQLNTWSNTICSFVRLIASCNAMYFAHIMRFNGSSKFIRFYTQLTLFKPFFDAHIPQQSNRWSFYSIVKPFIFTFSFSFIAILFIIFFSFLVSGNVFPFDLSTSSDSSFELSFCFGNHQFNAILNWTIDSS